MDNNQAERDVRMVKLQQRSRLLPHLCLRAASALWRSYLQTGAKHGIGQLDALTRLLNGDPWMPAASDP